MISVLIIIRIIVLFVRCYGIQWYDYRSFLPRPFFSLRMCKYKFKGYERLSLLEQVVFILRVLLCFLLWIPASISFSFPERKEGREGTSINLSRVSPWHVRGKTAPVRPHNVVSTCPVTPSLVLATWLTTWLVPPTLSKSPCQLSS